MKKVKLFFKYDTSDYKAGSIHEIDENMVAKYVGQGALIAVKAHEKKKQEPKKQEVVVEVKEEVVESKKEKKSKKEK